MWFWNSEARRYYNDETGQFMARDAVLGYVQSSLDGTGVVTDTLASLVGEGRLAPTDWRFLMREEIKREYIRQYLLGIGGRDQMTFEDWGRIGGMLSDQYRYLEGFYNEIATGRLSEEQIAARARMYVNSAREAYERANGQTWGAPPLPAYPGDGSTACLCITTPEARVLTARGWLPMLDVRVGDLVLTHRERWKPVIGLVVKPASSNETEVLFDLPGGLLGCTENHLWYTAQGWVQASDVGNSLYSMYNYLNEEVNHAYKNMCPVRFAFVESQQPIPMPILSGGMCLRQLQGLQGCELSLVRIKEEYHRAMEYRPGQGKEAQGAAEGRDRASNPIRGSRQAQVANEARRTSPEQVLGRGQNQMGLPIPVVVDNGERSDSQGLCCASQEWRCGGRQAGESGTASQSCSCQGTWSEGAREECRGAACLEVPLLRQGVPPLPTRQEWHPKVLFSRALPRGAAIYDLIVEDDHSFIIEGLVAHNTNCACSWSIESAEAEEAVMRWAAYWRLGPVKGEHCDDCLYRASVWAPLVLEQAM